MLTGKCKEDFEKWYALTNLTGDEFPMPHILEFYTYPFSMQYGVYVDFFDSHFIDVVLEEWNITSVMEKHNRLEARQKAIEKANEIYNSTQ